MARKRTLDRRALRSDFDEAEGRQNEEAEEREDDEDEGEDEDDEGEDEEEGEGEGEGEAEAEAEGEDDVELPKPKKKAKKAPAPAKPKPKSRSRAAKVVRMKVTWGVFNNSNQQVESFPYSEKSDAEALATKLTNDKKQTHFVQSVKKPFEEKEKEK